MSDNLDSLDVANGIPKSLMPRSADSEVILACGGKSTRMGQNKLLVPICAKPCILRSCEAFDKIDEVRRIIVAAPKELWREYSEILSPLRTPVTFVDAGATRQESVMNGVEEAKEEIIMIHDGARPLISRRTILDSIADTIKYGSSVVCVPCKDTIRYDDGCKAYSPDRKSLYAVQTPQSFSRRLYLYAAHMADSDYTDDAQLLDSAGFKPHITIGEYANIKLTTPEDIIMANSLSGSGIRIGHGYDVHRLVEGRRLVLGGVEINYQRGLLGHSDADVLTHALMDSLLGAAALGDIGKLFPDNDPEYEGANSIRLLERVAKLLAEKGYSILNCDITVIAQAPKLSPHIGSMRQRLSAAMGIPVERVSVKATTEEGLGFTGQKEGIAAHAVSLICG